MSSQNLYPTPSQELLKSHFIGKNIYNDNIQGPAAILNKTIVQKNCDLLLSRISRLNLDFRAHVKTHKTLEVTKLQVGNLDRVNIVCSTVSEIVFHVPLLKEYQGQGRAVSVIYGIPPSSTCFARLEEARKVLGDGVIGFLIDHPSQLQHIKNTGSGSSKTPTPVWIKVDSGQHRAGIIARGTDVDTLLQSVSDNSAHVKLQGIYSHNSTSYSVKSRAQALEYLTLEIREAQKVADKARLLGLEGTSTTTKQNQNQNANDNKKEKLTITVGASPSVTSIYHLDENSNDSLAFKSLLNEIKKNYTLELHAGVYPILDVQQMDTHESTTDTQVAPVTSDKVGLRILAEVLSIYTEREKPEALIGAGCLALGREPAKSYSGFGLVAPRRWDTVRTTQDMLGRGWSVARISQEHGNLVWNSDGDSTTASTGTGTTGNQEKEAPEEKLEIGSKVTVIPNHACIASAGFDWYLVVDGDEGEIVEDVWVRCRGW